MGFKFQATNWIKSDSGFGLPENTSILFPLQDDISENPFYNIIGLFELDTIIYSTMSGNINVIRQNNVYYLTGDLLLPFLKIDIEDELNIIVSTSTLKLLYFVIILARIYLIIPLAVQRSVDLLLMSLLHLLIPMEPISFTCSNYHIRGLLVHKLILFSLLLHSPFSILPTGSNHFNSILFMWTTIFDSINIFQALCSY